MFYCQHSRLKYLFSRDVRKIGNLKAIVHVYMTVSLPSVLKFITFDMMKLVNVAQTCEKETYIKRQEKSLACDYSSSEVFTGFSFQNFSSVDPKEPLLHPVLCFDS